MSARPSSVPAIWVLAADRSQARLLQSLPGDTVLAEVETFEHPEGRLRDHELVSDAPGQSIGPGYRQGAPTQKEPPGVHETQTFARQLAQRLARLRGEHAIERLYLIAEPHFLGVLRAELDEATRKLVAGEVHHRLVTEPVATLRAALPKTL